MSEDAPKISGAKVRFNGQNGPEVRIHSEARTLRVSVAGHLVLCDVSGIEMAVYPAGEWTGAELMVDA